MGQATFEAELAHDETTFEWRARQLFARREDAERDGQVERRTALGNVGGREVDGHPLEWKLVPRIDQRRVHPLATLLDSRLGKPDRCERGQAGREIHLDVHRQRADPHDGRGTNAGEHR